MATRREVVWSRLARRTLDEILDYVAQESPTAAGNLLSTALDRASSLGTLADRGRIVPEVGVRNVRELLIGRYRMLYEVRDDIVIVLAMIHGARDFARWRRRG